MIHPTGKDVGLLEITGACYPPSKTEWITLPRFQNLMRGERGEVVSATEPHLMVGGFSPTTWLDLYEEWRCEALLW